MIPQPFEQITQADLETLIASGVAECKTIDYKQELPGSTDADKKEFLADVSSFANTAGGDIVFGIAESQGLPTSIIGIATSNVDLEFRRLDSIIASGIDPRIRYATRTVTCGTVQVVIVRVERSWTGPHRVIFKGHDKFYGRNSAGKYPLDVTELRSAFTLSASVNEKIRAFRIDRIIAISNGDTPVPMETDAKIIIHCMPMESFSGQRQYDVLPYHSNLARLQPINSHGWDGRINLEGVVSYSGHSPITSYTQLYRNGVIEAVAGGLLHHEHRGRIVIPSISYESEIVSYLPKCFQILREMGVSTPLVVALTLTGVKDFEMGVDSMGWERSQKITVDTLVLPEAIVNDLNSPAATVLRPLFDMVWNACGFPRSKNFDGHGHWVDRR